MPIDHILNEFKNRFPTGKTPIVVSAPGRVNLIGEHTDYNDGFVFPMAVNAKITIAGSLRDDNQVHLFSLDFNQASQFSLDAIEASTSEPWSNYIRGVCAMFVQRGLSLQGMNLVLQGDVPQGAGLSSSAALEVGTALLVDNLHNSHLQPVDIVKLAQKAENQFVGVQCGIMDQFISMLAEEMHGLFLDCRSLEYRLVKLPFPDHSVIVIDSGVKRGLVDSEYNKRRQQCSSAVTMLGRDIPNLKSLRDVSVTHLPLVNQLPDPLARRARHVVTENERVLKSIAALQANDIAAFGELMIESHRSLRDDYEVSCLELDLLVELANSVPGTLGSRMTGAGFGGCTVSLVSNDSIEDFRNQILEKYHAQTGKNARMFVFTASKGASRIC